MSPSTIVLFDLDGTLTKARSEIRPEMLEQLLRLKSRVPIAIVSGSDYDKIAAQFGCYSVLEKIDFVFSENGLVVHKFGEEAHRSNIVECLGEDLIQRFINYCFEYMSKLQLPRKRGTFIEFRNGLINVSPVGRSCSEAERREFYNFDQKFRIREKFIEALQAEFGTSDLQFFIGGEISFDVFPRGWDKRYCLQFLKDFETIYFFGDKTEPGGNDHEIFHDPRTIGYKVTSPEDTAMQLQRLFP
ncbi:unnamed protein product [Dicrocoelium dendriticum]|nr:unnamed protein product [Dicrocoelium dendriticum]